ncbi:MAG: signal recognition particle subunit SRP19/SEC65 family protein [Candidatus Korarchaeota archaeon]|nr:signal recognition particle subunit SRP19/SEC65 family protein [Candidatus Korarchaeota archaeon]
MPRKGPKVIYPSYFDSRLSRSEGRRVPRSLAVRKPTLQDLVSALKHLSLEYEVEEKHRPSRWYRFEGRVKVVYQGSKEELLKKVAETIRRSRK